MVAASPTSASQASFTLSSAPFMLEAAKTTSLSSACAAGAVIVIAAARPPIAANAFNPKLLCTGMKFPPWVSICSPYGSKPIYPDEHNKESNFLENSCVCGPLRHTVSFIEHSEPKFIQGEAP